MQYLIYTPIIDTTLYRLKFCKYKKPIDIQKL